MISILPLLNHLQFFEYLNHEFFSSLFFQTFKLSIFSLQNFEILINPFEPNMTKKRNQNLGKRTSRDISMEGRSETTSLGSEQIQKKAAQSTGNKFSQMLSKSN